MSHALRSFLRLAALAFVVSDVSALASSQTTDATPPASQSTPVPPPKSETAPQTSAPQAPAPTTPSAPTQPELIADFTSIVWTPVRPATPATSDDELVISAVGDIMLGSTFPEVTGKELPPDDGLHLLDEVAPFFKASDLSIGNLEGPLYDGSDPSPKCKGKAEGTCYAFRVPTRYAKLLADAGFVAMGVANNHAKDFGVTGQQSTLAALTSAGIAQSGAPGVVARFLVKGKKVSYIAFATYPQFNNALDLETSSNLVREEAARADYVIVSFHGGAEGANFQHVPAGHEMFLGEDRGDLRTFTHTMIDAGAAMVFGHGPHVVRGMELYKGRLIAYSLGNFATYGHINLRGVNGLTLVLTARLGKNGQFLGGAVHPAYQDYPGGPHVDPNGRVLQVLRSLSQSDFGKSAIPLADDGNIAAPAVAPMAVDKPAALPVAQD